MTAGAVISDRYEVIRGLGQGAFGRTLLARDLRLDRPVALKVLHGGKGVDWKAYELFEREATVLRELRHHAIPAIHASFRAPWDGAEAAFLVMEYVEGTSLATLIAERRHLSRDEVVHIFLELLGVLDYLHSRVPPVIHRDLKPANIILRPDGSPALVDFGAVRNVFRAADEDGSTVVGTYGYMPYEQYMGQAGPSSDLYAMAATMLHVVTGRPPPAFMTDAGRLAVPEALPCGESLRRVLARMLEAAPSARYASAREARTAMMQAAAGSDRVAEPAGAGTAVVAGGGGAVAERLVDVPVSLPPEPRALAGATLTLFRRVCPSTWELLNGTIKPPVPMNAVDLLTVTFFSVVTLGILPVVFWGAAINLRGRAAPFFREGVQGVARITGLAQEDFAFGEKLVRVRYEFEADGRTHRVSATIRPAYAEHWTPGELIQILYLPLRNYDSIIIST